MQEVGLVAVTVNFNKYIKKQHINKGSNKKGDKIDLKASL